MVFHVHHEKSRNLVHGDRRSRIRHQIENSSWIKLIWHFEFGKFNCRFMINDPENQVWLEFIVHKKYSAILVALFQLDFQITLKVKVKLKNLFFEKPHFWPKELRERKILHSDLILTFTSIRRRRTIWRPKIFICLANGFLTDQIFFSINLYFSP